MVGKSASKIKRWHALCVGVSFGTLLTGCNATTVGFIALDPDIGPSTMLQVSVPFGMPPAPRRQTTAWQPRQEEERGAKSIWFGASAVQEAIRSPETLPSCGEEVCVPRIPLFLASFR